MSLIFGVNGFTQIKLPKVLKKDFVYVPAGSRQVGVDKDTLALQSYYMATTEVDNNSYNQFLSYLKEHDKTEELGLCLVDSSKWNLGNYYSEPYKINYHSHIAYNDYPVVNVSYKAALEYCKWLNVLFKDLSEKYIYEFSLPTRAEWMYAAQGDKFFRMYSWNSPFLKRPRGEYQANFIHFSESMVRFNEDAKIFELISPTLYEPDMVTDFADILAPVKSYWPSPIGLYNMNGNASEMVLEEGVAVGGSWRSGGYDIRNESFINYADPKPTVGFRVKMTVAER